MGAHYATLRIPNSALFVSASPIVVLVAGEVCQMNCRVSGTEATVCEAAA
jgi:hypothetical protein